MVANEMSKERFTCDGCIVHKGFYEATRVFLEQAFPIVLTLKKDLLSYTIKVTGHSLGAALALLAANELRLLNLDVTLITLAGPKVGDSKFSEWMDRFWNTDLLISNLKDARGNKFPLNTFTRVTNHQDIIPLAPLAAMGFAHCGCEIRIGKGMELSVRGKWTYIHEAQDLKAVSKFLENITEYGQWESAINRKDLMARHAYYFLKVNECIHK
ncbi:DEKNAAC100087 [Brettanomyces naardenensis]|uniref:triacylglycerol lipase n=1 Tax=Brettanomyces naardenensis TaxID=13370 RepID=A0A448YF28_BRENA|nr:DEKNAAC100087 [Brettanomyces naardenensis]